MKFVFGEDSDRMFIEAKNLAQAIKVYKIKELFPEKHVWNKHIKEYTRDDDGNKIYTYKVTDPKIPIHIWKEQGKDKLVGEISLREAVEVDYNALIPSQTVNLLEAPEVEVSDETALIKVEPLPIIGDPRQVSLFTKVQLREKHNELEKKENELKAMIQSMHESMSVMKKELDKKIKAVYMLETYLGINEEIIQLVEGAPAPEGTPLTLFQQKLYMDEELGIWSDGGADFKDIEKWDKWISKHYEMFLYAPKSICTFQIRRTKKEYSQNAWENDAQNQPNWKTYFLIRNGTNLYRIWSDVHIEDRLFPSETEYRDILTPKKDDHWWREKEAQEEIKSKHLSYLYGVIAIQGIVERTDILGTEIKTKLNLMMLNEDMLEYVKFVRDDETNHWITSGKPSWRDFLKANQQAIDVGTRVTLIKDRMGHHWKNEDKWRTAPYHASWPVDQFLYTVESRKVKDTYFGEGDYIVRYNPGDEVWGKSAEYWRRGEYHERKRRVPFRFYSDEAVNFDAITIEDCEYYRTNRNERKAYLEILPTMHWIIKIKKEEQALEEEFTKFIAGRLKWDESRYPEVREATKWWKLKNKWKRALSKDEAKAVRMILKKLTSEKQ